MSFPNPTICSGLLEATADALKNAEKADMLMDRASSLRDEFQRTNSLESLNEAISVGAEAVIITPRDHKHLALYLGNHAIHLGDRFARRNFLEDLETCIEMEREAIRIIGLDHADRSGHLAYLSARMGDRFKARSQPSDLDEAIRLAEEALKFTSGDHRDYAARLNNLATQLGDKYYQTRSLTDLDRAISLGREAKEVCSGLKDQRDLARYSNNLATRLGDRFIAEELMADCNEAIQLAEEAIQLAQNAATTGPAVNEQLASYNTTMCILLGYRFTRTKLEDDLENSLQHAEAAVGLTDLGHPMRAGRLTNLAVRLGDRFQWRKKREDLEAAISYGRVVLEIVESGNRRRGLHLSNLGAWLRELWHLQRDDLAPLNEAINLGMEAVDVINTPTDHPERARRLQNVGHRLVDRYLRNKDNKDYEDASACFHDALTAANSSTKVRVSAGEDAMELHAGVHNWSRAYEIAKEVISLIRRLPARSLEDSDKQYILSQVTGLAADAGAIALNAGKDAATAVNLLEHGRGVLATSLEEIRIDVNDLQARDPALAAQFTRLQATLDASMGESRALQTAADIRHQAGRDLDDLLVRIRTLTGFERFLLPLEDAELRGAASCGPIIVVNVSRYRCDTLIIEPESIWSLPLPKLRMEDVVGKRQAAELGAIEMLGWLWEAVAYPVLDKLKLVRQQDSNEWPSVWWILTGPLSRFPIHAAGRYTGEHSDSVMDRVISSYGSSIKAIVHGRARQNRVLMPEAKLEALLIAMKDTPGLQSDGARLYYAEAEILSVREICEQIGLQILDQKRQKEEVIDALSHCHIFHFAGHGETSMKDPADSKLLLDDWESTPMTVAHLRRINLRRTMPFLAYLSACNTGQVSQEQYLDEGVHLIGAFQLAGFRHVIGTLWEVNDKLCVTMAKMTYESIRDGAMSDRSVREGLHHASRELRSCWLRQIELATEDVSSEQPSSSGSNRESKLLPSGRDDEAVPGLWIPYVHFGV